MNEVTGRNLQVLRLQQGIKAKDVALKMGISPSYYSEIERERKPVPTNSEFLRSLSDALGIPESVFEGVVGFSEHTGRPMSPEQKVKTQDYIKRTGSEFFLMKALGRIQDDHEFPGAYKALREDRDAIADLITNDWPRIRTQLANEEATEEARLLGETESDFLKRLADLERVIKYFFLDSKGLMEALVAMESAPDKSTEFVVLKAMAKSLGKMQPLVEQGVIQLLKDGRTLRKIAKRVKRPDAQKPD